MSSMVNILIKRNGITAQTASIGVPNYPGM